MWYKLHTTLTNSSPIGAAFFFFGLMYLLFVTPTVTGLTVLWRRAGLQGGCVHHGRHIAGWPPCSLLLCSTVGSICGWGVLLSVRSITCAVHRMLLRGRHGDLVCLLWSVHWVKAAAFFLCFCFWYEVLFYFPVDILFFAFVVHHRDHCMD